MQEEAHASRDRGPPGRDMYRILMCLALVATLTACVMPAQRADRAASRLGLIKRIVQGTEFRHVVYLKLGSRPSASLHVYIEGDGSPWIGGEIESDDPTPRNLLVLKLMALDPSPSVYLGRPCYFGLARDAGCSAALWTSERYSERVVASTAAALRTVMQQNASRALVLIGHSGGGTLAMLLAARMSKVRAVVTLAGNLDPDAWAAYHGYEPLRGLSPARQPALSPEIREIHCAGGRDRNMPLAILRAAAARSPRAELLVFPDFDHACCWEGVWRQLQEHWKLP